MSTEELIKKYIETHKMGGSDREAKRESYVAKTDRRVTQKK